MPSLIHNGQRFVLQCTYDERLIAKEAGCQFDGYCKCWWTASPTVATKLREYAGPEVIAKIDEAFAANVKRDAEIAEKAKALAEEKAKRQKLIVQAATGIMPADVEFIPRIPEGMKLFPHQLSAPFLMSSGDSCLLADDMGLGKTAQALVIFNQQKINRGIIICPASLKQNWLRECRMWLVDGQTVQVVNSPKDALTAQIVIVNYELLGKMHPQLAAHRADGIVFDEAHYIKNHKAKRTESSVALAQSIRLRIACTGTPILNRPAELFVILQLLKVNQHFGFGFRAFAERYCDGVDEYGCARGASNLRELHDTLVRTCMIRRKKADVLSSLPAKLRTVISRMPETAAEKKAVAAEMKLHMAVREASEKAKALTAKWVGMTDGERTSQAEAKYRSEIAKLRAISVDSIGEISKARHETALMKVPFILEHIGSLIAGGLDKIVVFAHHKDVIAAITEGLKSIGTDKVDLRPVVINGDVPTTARQGLVDRFQTDKGSRAFVGQFSAAGTGLTLTSASHVIIAEQDWTPAVIMQAEDRCHRIGQRNCVIVQHVIFDESIDSMMMPHLLRKMAIMDSAIDGLTPDADQPIDPSEIAV